MTEFITRNYGNEDFEIIIKTDSKNHYKATEDFARRLIGHAKPMTNADRIRAMSDEELADVVKCPHADNWDLCIRNCFNCRIKWLQQPVKEK